MTILKAKIRMFVLWSQGKLKGFKKLEMNRGLVKIDKTSDIIHQLTSELNNIEREINVVIKNLIEAQAIGIKSWMSNETSLMGSVKSKWYRSAARESANWHSKRLIELQKDKRRLQIELEIVTGRYWPNQIRRWIKMATLILLGIFLVWVFLMGLIAAIYLIPIWISIVIIYYFIRRNTKRFK